MPTSRVMGSVCRGLTPANSGEQGVVVQMERGRQSTLDRALAACPSYAYPTCEPRVECQLPNGDAVPVRAEVAAGV